MKTRIRVNNERNSVQLDIIYNGELTSHYFDSVEDAKEYQKFRINLEKK